MDRKTEKEIEIKNIVDILIENLRIKNQINDNESIEKYQLLSEEDVNVELLDFRNPEFGAKLLKRFRKVLHKEIRDWTIQPLQKKQTSFNRKTNENLSFLYSQIQSYNNKMESIDEKVDSNQDTIRSVTQKIDSNQDTIRSVNEKINSVNEKADSVNEKINSVNEKADTNQDTIRSVTQKINSNQDTIRSVNEKVDSVNEKLDSVNEKADTIIAVNEKLDSVNEKADTNQNTIINVNEKLDSVNEKADTNQNTIIAVNEKLDSVNEKADTIITVNEKVDSVNEKADTNQNTIRSLNEKVDSVNEKIESVALTLEKTLEKMIKENFVSLRETFEIETIVKEKFLTILKRYPRTEDLKYFVTEIKDGKINVADFELKLRNTPEYKDVKLLEHYCIYTKFGTKMYLNRNDNVISKDLALKQVWEPDETDILRKLIKKGMNVVDLGANVGYYTLLFSKWVGKNGLVFSFEPESDNFEILKRNLVANQVKNVKAFQKAVSNQNQSKLLFLAPENKGDHKIIDLNEGDNLEKIIVDCVTLNSSEVSKFPIDLIKMDIQGAEMLALKGMTKILEKNPNLVLFTEFWPYGIEKSGYSPKAFFDKLKSFDFKISVIKNKKLVPIENDFELLTKYQSDDYVNLLCKR